MWYIIGVQYMYVSQNIEWLILFCSLPWCIHWPSRRFSPQLWRFVIKISMCFFFKFWCMFILAFDWDKISGWKLKKFHFSLIWFSCNIMIWFINVLNCSQMYLLMMYIWRYNLFLLSVHGESNPQQLCTTGKGNNSLSFLCLSNSSMNEWCD